MMGKLIEVTDDVEAMEKRLQPALEDNRGLEHLVRDRLG
jgi:hypothetical protein